MEMHIPEIAIVQKGVSENRKHGLKPVEFYNYGAIESLQRRCSMTATAPLFCN